MPEINLCNESGRDAVVTMENVVVPVQIRWVDGKGRGARNIRILKSTLDHDVEALQETADGIENVHQLLIEGDPEIDIVFVRCRSDEYAAN